MCMTHALGEARSASVPLGKAVSGDHGKGSSAIEGKENRRLRDVQIKQDIPRSKCDDPRSVQREA